MAEYSKQVDHLWQVFGMPAWIAFVPVLLELEQIASARICMGRAYREGFEAGITAALKHSVFDLNVANRFASKLVERNYAYETN